MESGNVFKLAAFALQVRKSFIAGFSTLKCHYHPERDGGRLEQQHLKTCQLRLFWFLGYC